MAGFEPPWVTGRHGMISSKNSGGNSHYLAHLGHWQQACPFIESTGWLAQ